MHIDPTIRPASTQLMVKAFVFALGLASCGPGTGTEPGADASANETGGGADSGGLAAQGERIAQRLRCSSCHTPLDPRSPELSGQETPVEGTRAYAPNLTPDRGTGLGDWSDEDILRAVREGIDDEGAMLCVMPRFMLTDSEGRALVAYLRSLRPVAHMVPETMCSDVDAGRADTSVPRDVQTRDVQLRDVQGPDVQTPPMDVVMPPPDATMPDAMRDVAVLDAREAGVGDAGVDARPAEAGAPDGGVSEGGACAGRIVVNEVQVGGAGGASDEFVELYNAGDCEVSLEGWTLRYAASTSTTVTRRWTGTVGQRLAPRGFAVVGGQSFMAAGVTVLGTFAGSGGVLAAAAGSVGVFNPSDVRVDSVGYGDGTSSPLLEGMSAMTPAVGQSIVRVPDGADTNMNRTDFRLSMTPTPGAMNR